MRACVWPGCPRARACLSSRSDQPSSSGRKSPSILKRSRKILRTSGSKRGHLIRPGRSNAIDPVGPKYQSTPRKPQAPGLPLAEPIETKRRLAAIFAADVEGYSRLMGADEVGYPRCPHRAPGNPGRADCDPWRPHRQHGGRQRAGGVRQRRGCRPVCHGGSGCLGQSQLGAALRTVTSISASGSTSVT